MSRLIIVEPMPMALIAAERGTGVQNLASPDPKEVWVDSAVGSTVRITIDLGQVQTIDTIFFGHLRNAATGATWGIEVAGAAPATQLLPPTTILRVPDVAGTVAALSHALWTGSPVQARYVTLMLLQPAGAPPLSAGSMVIGSAFTAQLGQEWGAGRQPIDTGTATALTSGGFAVVEGVRKRRFSWTFGDLSVDEADRLELIALSRGETRPVLVVDDPSLSAGLVARIRYGKFDKWREFERRNRRQTRWEISVEDWV